jgi:hypothetical protein
MNYLAHFVFNHDVCGLPSDPHFAMGVALPDLWPRFSRRRRIRWQVVRDTRPADEHAAQLRAGLLNHVAVDGRFHALPCFLHWQRELKADTATGGTCTATWDLASHVALEFALDRHLVCRDADLAERFYTQLAACDLGTVEQQVGMLAGVDARGLRRTIGGLLARRYLHRFRSISAVRQALQLVLELGGVRPLPAKGALDELVSTAALLVDPQCVWAGLSAAFAANVHVPEAWPGQG